MKKARNCLTNAQTRSSLLLYFFVFVCLTLSQNSVSAQSAKSSAIPETLRQTKSVLVLGDSLSAAYGIPVEKGWVALMEQSLGSKYEVINASISGETTGGGLRALPSLLEKHQPDIVIIELGANDGLRGFPLPTISKNLSKLIELSQKTSAQVVLVGMRIPPNYGAPYAEAFHQLYAKLSAQYETALVPFLLDDIAIHAHLMQRDQLHPTAEAQDKMKAYVLDALNGLAQ